jgi:hypothetical protein
MKGLLPILTGLQDLGEYVVPSPLAVENVDPRPEVVAWRLAAAEARAAYADWCRCRGADSYAVYRACADRADAAQAAVARRSPAGAAPPNV